MLSLWGLLPPRLEIRKLNASMSQQPGALQEIYDDDDYITIFFFQFSALVIGKNTNDLRKICKNFDRYMEVTQVLQVVEIGWKFWNFFEKTLIELQKCSWIYKKILKKFSVNFGKVLEKKLGTEFKIFYNFRKIRGKRHIQSIIFGKGGRIRKVGFIY